MADFSALIQRIKDAVYENGVQAITGQILQDCLKDVVNTVNVAKQDGIYRVTVTVDNNTGVPSATARMDDDTYTLEFSFHNLKGETGPQGPQGDTPVLTADSDGVIYSDGVMLTRVIKDTTDALTTRADSDHTRAESDHARAETDHGTAESDHATAASDHTQAGTDHTQATSDHTTASADHTQAEADHTASETATQAAIDAADAATEAAETIDAKIAGKADESEVSQLRSEVDGLSVIPYTLEQGSIASATGSDTSSTTRIRTNGYLSSSRLRVIPGNGKASVLAYNESGYIICSTWFTATVDVAFTGATKYRVVFAKTNDSTINVSDFSTLGMGLFGIVGNNAEHIDEDADILGCGKRVFDIGHGANYCDPENITIKAGAYIKMSDGTYKSSGLSGSAGVTGYIPVDGKVLYCAKAMSNSSTSWVAYRLATDAELTDSDVNKFAVGNDVVVRSHSGNTTSGKYYQYQDGDVYVRFTLSSTTDVMVNEGATPLPYVPYVGNIKLGDSLIGKNIGIENIRQTDMVFNGKNLCNPDECFLSDNYYMDGTSGLIRSASSSQSRGTTGMIPIDEDGIYCEQSYVAGVNIGYAYFDENGNYITGYTQNNPIQGGTAKFAKYVSGAKWVVFTIAAGVTDVMVSKGNMETPYEDYAGRKEVISKDILPDFVQEQEEKKTLLDGVEIILPAEIVITQTDRLQIFFRDIITSFNPGNFAVECICSVGKPMPRCFDYVPTVGDVGKSYPLFVRIYDNAHRLVSSASTTIKVVANASSPGSQKNILLVGDSVLYDGTIAKEMSRRFTKNTGDGTYYNPTGLGLSNIAFVGRTTTSDAFVNQESQSGWQWKDYATSGRSAYRFFVTNIGSYDLREGAVYSGDGTLKFAITEINLADGYFSCTYEGSGTQPASGTLTKYSGDGSDSVAYDSYNIDSRNPFWDNANEELDFTSYITDYCGGRLDILVSYLGINDLFQSRTPAETITNYVIPFLRELHTQSPSTKVVLCNLHIPSPDGGMGKTYGATARTYWRMTAKYFDYIKRLNELVADAEFSSWVSIASTFQEFDADNLYPTINTRTICNRSEATETTQSDGVHPTTNGKKAIADSIYHKITQLL